MNQLTVQPLSKITILCAALIMISIGISATSAEGRVTKHVRSLSTGSHPNHLTEPLPGAANGRELRGTDSTFQKNASKYSAKEKGKTDTPYVSESEHTGTSSDSDEETYRTTVPKKSEEIRAQNSESGITMPRLLNCGLAPVNFANSGFLFYRSLEAESLASTTLLYAGGAATLFIAGINTGLCAFSWR